MFQVPTLGNIGLETLVLSPKICSHFLLIQGETNTGLMVEEKSKVTVIHAVSWLTQKQVFGKERETHFQLTYKVLESLFSSLHPCLHFHLMYLPHHCFSGLCSSSQNCFISMCSFEAHYTHCPCTSDTSLKSLRDSP